MVTVEPVHADIVVVDWDVVIVAASMQKGTELVQGIFSLEFKINIIKEEITATKKMNILDLCYVAVGNCWYLEMNILELVLRVFQ